MLQILAHLKKLLESKDRELLHHVLFSLKNYHEPIIKCENWLILPSEAREMYQDILQNYLKKTESYLVQSWRYHLTYLKVLETIADSHYDHNEEYIQELTANKSNFGTISQYN